MKRVLETIAVAIMATSVIIVMFPIWLVQGWLHPDRLPEYGRVRHAKDKK